MKSLTKKQYELLSYIKTYLQTHHYAPSYREIMQHFSFSSLGTVYKYITILKSKGLLESKKKSSRSLSLLHDYPTKKNFSSLSLPFIGYISAGEPIETFPRSLSFEVPSSLVTMPEATYILKVRGDSLVEELLADGDYLVVEARQEVQAGETVLALLNQNDVIIKKYFLEDVYVRLVSRSLHNHPVILREEDIMVQGVVVAVIRKNF
ncbi:LexA repressor [Neochlamydia sp. EPS4]|uniref:transcriptional repressor LexA n=1 Tax=Neochlamydia sp. EPS4 TaxID=1478175 RepID=UPI00057D13E4|nr:transcriptional repressor LexA [Neochlamydia sp. EPS4]KIC76384.1 LexA repressor [Neochlamydia sp. EPS4]KIC77113.1 LexA repressor [Neochlamydia sp. TUME1]